ncbi:DVU_1556 family methyltransferase [Halodesulfovibrio marinisediminis]|uniref:Methyltransferase domain-containing protein n=1 Tax=Halodesulfovibrio marinisediminis DSM 17456 TaxID=1121457 RepID=A0A1N6GWQ1_9BACT|nr:class I SAM-dependent methyltransferase [Halodesulfovibrio marinisediminis]SIO11958.1 Methyltransferase domain-containing protein [Halodesulfovibrio marinisediminis DSM 17456]
MSTPLWQHPRMATLDGGVLRPGGLALTRRTYDSLRIATSTRILDAGCGTGITGEFLQQEYGAHVTGLDLSSQNTLLTNEKNIPTVQGTVEQLPFSDASFHIVNCDCVLSLCNSLETAIAEFSRVLCADGTLVLSDLYKRQEHNMQSAQLCCGSSGQKIPTQTHKKSSTNGCSSSPIKLKELFETLTKAGFTHTCSTDCTKELKELTAKLIFSDIATCCQSNTQDRPSAYDRSIGYIQVKALKKE